MFTTKIGEVIRLVLSSSFPLVASMVLFAAAGNHFNGRGGGGGAFLRRLRSLPLRHRVPPRSVDDHLDGLVGAAGLQRRRLAVRHRSVRVEVDAASEVEGAVHGQRGLLVVIIVIFFPSEQRQLGGTGGARRHQAVPEAGPLRVGLGADGAVAQAKGGQVDLVVIQLLHVDALWNADQVAGVWLLLLLIRSGSLQIRLWWWVFARHCDFAESKPDSR